MTVKQQLLKIVYPLLRRYTKASGRKGIYKKKEGVEPLMDFYSLNAAMTDGSTLNFSELKGKKVLIVNTASDCGFTAQYEELQQLHESYGHLVTIIAFPANDFKQQETGSDEAIANFCKKNYGISFPLAKKAVVIKTQYQNPVFQWLTSKELNGWNNRPPSWNFSKYLIDEKGVLQFYCEPYISPMSDDFLHILKQ